MKTKTKRGAKEVHPFNIGLALSHMSEAIDELNWASLGFKPSERNNFARLIARLAILVKNQPNNEAAKKEYDNLLEKYEKEYAWIDQTV